jgi:hypothetical protein
VYNPSKVYNLREIPGFKTLKAFKFGPKLWRCVDCVTDGSKTDPYEHQIGEWAGTLYGLIAWATVHYEGQYR